MKTKRIAFVLGILAALSFTACGKEDPALANFKTEMDAFCTAISKIDTSINDVDAQSEDATTELLNHLDDLDKEFQNFAELDFPEEFDYLEPLADEAGKYMSEAVANYHKAYADASYDENTATYAKENYARAYKRIQIIITFLHGEEPEDVDLIISTEET